MFWSYLLILLWIWYFSCPALKFSLALYYLGYIHELDIMHKISVDGIWCSPYLIWECSVKVCHTSFTDLRMNLFALCSWSFRKSLLRHEERRHLWKNFDIKVENIMFWGTISIWLWRHLLGLVLSLAGITWSLYLLFARLSLGGISIARLLIYLIYGYFRFEHGQWRYHIIFAQVRIFWNTLRSFSRLNCQYLSD